MSWAFLVCAIVTEACATLSLKASGGLRRKTWVVPIVFGYAISFWFLSLSLSRGVPLGVAYGIWAACGVAVTAVAARFLFGEQLTRVMGLGLFLIACGVLLIEYGSHA